MKTDATTLQNPPLTVPANGPTTRRRSFTALWLLVLLLVAAVLIFGIRWITSRAIGGVTGPEFSKEDGGWVEVKHSDFEVVCREDGELLPVKVTAVGFTRWGRLTWIAEEGTHIKKGEKIAAIDTEDLETELQTLEDLLANTQRNMAQQEQARDLDARKFETELRSAKDQLELSILKESELLAKPTPLDKEEATNIQKTARVKVESAQAEKEANKPLKEKGYITQTDWDTKCQNLRIAEIEQEVAGMKAKLILDGALPEERQRAALDRHAAELAYEQKKLDWDDAKNGYESKLRTAKFQVEQAKHQIEDRKQKMIASTRFAPHDGLVVRRPMRWNSDKKSDVGDYVSPWAAPIDLPSYDIMKVRTQIPESVASRMMTRKNGDESGNGAKAGSPARITVKTLPGTVYPGEVIWIDGWARDRNERLSEADMKAQGLSGLRVFDVEVELKSSDPERLREGFRATVDFPLETLKGVFSIPRQSVIVREGQTLVRAKRSGSELWLVVKLGVESNGLVVIQEGLQEGDAVWAPPLPVTPPLKQAPEMRKPTTGESDSGSDGSAAPKMPRKKPVKKPDPNKIQAAPGTEAGKATDPAAKKDDKAETPADPAKPKRRKVGTGDGSDLPMGLPKGHP